MPRIDNPNDPYSAPHAPKERGGPLVRVAIIALLLAGAGAGWTYFSSQPSQGLTPVEEAAIEQPVQVADAGAVTAPETANDATADAPAAAAPVPAPTPTRRAAPRSAPEPAPTPVTEPAPLAAPADAPLAPIPVEPAPMPAPQ